MAHCPAILVCHSQGETIKEVIENIKDAVRGCLESLDKDLFSSPIDQVSVEVAIFHFFKRFISSFISSITSLFFISFFSPTFSENK